MSATAQPTAPVLDTFRHQVGLTRFVVRRTVEGLTHEESLVQPRPAGSCLNWVMGHLTWAFNELLPLLGEQPVLPAPAVARYARGTEPLTDPADATAFATLVDAFDAACERADAGLARLSPEMLDRPAPASPTGDPDETIRSLLSTFCFHQAYHTGQLGLLRRLVGREGAIR